MRWIAGLARGPSQSPFPKPLKLISHGLGLVLAQAAQAWLGWLDWVNDSAQSLHLF